MGNNFSYEDKKSKEYLLNRGKDMENLMRSHVSVRNFSSEKIDEELLKSIIVSGQHSATSEFIQAYSVINVKDMNTRQAIFNEVTDQKHILNAPVFLVFCADMNRIISRGESLGTKAEGLLDFTEIFLVSAIDCTIFAQSVVLGAEAYGIGSTYIGGLRNNLEVPMELLNLPKGVVPLFGMVMGYPDEEKAGDRKPRLPLESVYMIDEYSREKAVDIEEYDEEISRYYEDRTGGVRSETWSEQMTGFIKKEHRPKLKEQILSKGFGLK